jgi:hypothetical protein
VLLERDLVLDGHVVAEEQHVQVAGEGLVRLQRGIVAGTEITATEVSGWSRSASSSERVRRRPNRRPPARARRTSPLRRVQRGVRGGVVGRADGEEQVAGARPVQVGGVEPLLPQRLDVRRRRHRDRRPLDAFDLAHRAGAGELDNGVQ